MTSFAISGAIFRIPPLYMGNPLTTRENAFNLGLEDRMASPAGGGAGYKLPPPIISRPIWRNE